MRSFAAIFVFGLVVTVCWLTFVGDQRTKAATEQEKAKLEKNDDQKAPAAEVDVATLLFKRVTLGPYSDPNSTLDEILKDLSKKYNVSFDINMRAFQNDGLKDPGGQPIADPDLPAMNNVRLETALRRILARVSNPTGATFLVRRDCIEITTNEYVRKEIWGEEFEGPFLPLVHVRADKVALGEVLAQLADQSGLSILYGGAAENAATPMSVRLTNVPVDTAVKLLAAQAGLEVVHRDNVLVVTSEEKANGLKKAFLEEKPEQTNRYRRGGELPLPRPQGM